MYCTACGKESNKFIFKKVISDKLASDWDLTSTQRHCFDLRESMFCPYCGNSTRARGLAAAIIKAIPVHGVSSLAEWIDWAVKKRIKVAEINYCGNLHPILSKLPGLKTSQYYETNLRAKIANIVRGITKEDITRLSYSNDLFDLVLHSDVLEHVADVNKALSECKRVLKPGGVCLFTIPVIFGRNTVKRAEINNNEGQVKHLLPPSYHGSGEPDYFVFWEFGGDFVKNNGLEVVYSEAETNTCVFSVSKNV